MCINQTEQPHELQIHDMTRGCPQLTEWPKLGLPHLPSPSMWDPTQEYLVSLFLSSLKHFQCYILHPYSVILTRTSESMHYWMIKKTRLLDTLLGNIEIPQCPCLFPLTHRRHQWTNTNTQKAPVNEHQYTEGTGEWTPIHKRPQWINTNTHQAPVNEHQYTSGTGELAQMHRRHRYSSKYYTTIWNWQLNANTQYNTIDKHRATSRDKKNHATSWDKNKSRNLLGQKKIM